MKTIIWKLLLKSDSNTVYNLLSNSEGRRKFWSEDATEEGNIIHFLFPNGQTYNSEIIKTITNKEFHLDYFNSLVKFKLESTKNGGTDLTLMKIYLKVIFVR